MINKKNSIKFPPKRRFMLTLCQLYHNMLKFWYFSLHLDLKDWKPFHQNIFGNVRTSSENRRKFSEVAMFSEIPVTTRRKSHTFDSEKVGRYIANICHASCGSIFLNMTFDVVQWISSEMFVSSPKHLRQTVKFPGSLKMKK